MICPWYSWLRAFLPVLVAVSLSFFISQPAQANIGPRWRREGGRDRPRAAGHRPATARRRPTCPDRGGLPREQSRERPKIGSGVRGRRQRGERLRGPLGRSCLAELSRGQGRTACLWENG